MQKKLIFLIFLNSIIFSCCLAQETETTEKLFERGYVHSVHNNYTKAIEAFQQFIELEQNKAQPNINHIARIHKYLANCYFNLYNSEKAISEYLTAIDCYNELKDSAKIALAYERLSAVFANQGKQRQALIYLKEALAYFEKNDWYSKLQVGYIQLGLLEFYNKNLDEAKHNLLNALRLRENSERLFENTYIEPEVYYYLGKIAYKEGKLRESLQYLTQGEIYCRKLVKQLLYLNEEWFNIKLLKSRIYAELNDFNKAVTEINFSEKLNNQNSWLQGEEKIQLEKALYFERKGQVSQSDSIFYLWVEKIEANPPVFLSATDLDFFSNIINHNERLYNQSGNLFYLEKKFHVLEIFLDISKNWQIISPFLRDLASFESQKNDLFDNTIETVYSLYKQTKDPNYFSKLFQFSERFTIGKFIEEQSLAANASRTGKNKMVRQLKSQINKLISEDSVITKRDKNASQKLVRLINRLEKVSTYLSKHKPISNNIEKDPLAELQKHLAQNEIYVKTYETNQSVFQMIITPDSTIARKVDKTPVFLQEISRFHYHLTNSTQQITLDSIQRFCHSAYYLYNVLLQPIESFIEEKELIIEWENHSREIAFEALLTSDVIPESLNMNNLPFLLKQNNVRYSGSVWLYLESLSRNYRDNPTTYVGFAPFIKTNSMKNHLSLPASEKEVEEAASLFDGVSYSGLNATKQKVMKLGPKSDILHLATHAQTHQIHPQLAELTFINSKEKVFDRLFYYEIMDGNWKNNLLILGACETSNGEFLVNYGTASLTNAFQGSGVKSVIGASWKVNDQISSQILLKTSSFIKKGMEASQALRKAKIDFLKDADDINSHPYFWSVYKFQGTPYFFIPKKETPFYLLFIFPMILLGYFLYKFLRNSKIRR